MTAEELDKKFDEGGDILAELDLSNGKRVLQDKTDEEILASFERDEWRSVSNLKVEISRLASIASASLK